MVVLAVLLGIASAPSVVAPVVAQGNALQEGVVPEPRPASPELLRVAWFDDVGGEAVVRHGDKVGVVLHLADPPAAQVYADTYSRTSRQSGVRRALAAARSHALDLQRTQQDLLSALRVVHDFEPQTTSRLAFNGITGFVAPDRLRELRRLPGVVAVEPLREFRAHLASSLPYIGIPALWRRPEGLPPLTGRGVRVGIIDTGIDYLHSNYGGSGAAEDYLANDTASLADGLFPTAKVVGGFDFVGDDFDSRQNPVISPDPDPMDCNGHGSHVAGIVAGFGAQLGGGRFPGPYDSDVPLEDLLIGPGVAPEALLYALKVFGCGLGTNSAPLLEALEFALDPNGDGDLSDHLDAINLSLGSNLGHVDGAVARAAENVARAGVLVVSSSGNDGDAYYVTSSPGVASSVVSVAASIDDGLVRGRLEVESPAQVAGEYAAGIGLFGPVGQLADRGGTLEENAFMVLADDGDDEDGEAATTDACQPLLDPDRVAGRFVVMDRGSCPFVTKVRHAQEAGAKGVIVINTLSRLGVLWKLDDGTGDDITIPCIGVGRADGDLLKQTLQDGLEIRARIGLRLDPELRDVLPGFSSRGPRAGGDSALKPDLAAPGASITSTQSGINEQGFVPDSDLAVLSGTSMSAPHVAGIAALLLQIRPDWSPQEIKASLMNTSLVDLFPIRHGNTPSVGASRSGAGRVEPQRAVALDVVAFNADQPGQVSVSFHGELSTAVRWERSVRVVNKGATRQSFIPRVEDAVLAPGVGFSLASADEILVPAEGEAEVTVILQADPDELRHQRPPPVERDIMVRGAAQVAREYLSEAAAHLVLEQDGEARLRVPLYATVQPAATMRAQAAISLEDDSGLGRLELSGSQLLVGEGFPPPDIASLVTPLVLHLVSERDPAFSGQIAAADVAYVGVGSDLGPFPIGDSIVYFGIATHTRWSTLHEVEFDVYIDMDEDGVDDFVVFNKNLGTLTGGTPTDDFQTFVIDVRQDQPTFGGIFRGLPINLFGPGTVATAPFNTNVVVLPVFASSIGLSSENTSFSFRVETCPRLITLCNEPNFGFGLVADVTDTGRYDLASPGLDFASPIGTTPVGLLDLDGVAIGVDYDLQGVRASGARGILLLHHHNTPAQRVQVVEIQEAQPADLRLVKEAAPEEPWLGRSLHLRTTLVNEGPGVATGVVVRVPLVPGLELTGFEASAGRWNPTTGLWRVDRLEAGDRAELQLVTRILESEPLTCTAEIVAADGDDPDSVPGNGAAGEDDRVEVTVRARELPRCSFPEACRAQSLP